MRRTLTYLIVAATLWESYAATATAAGTTTPYSSSLATSLMRPSASWNKKLLLSVRGGSTTTATATQKTETNKNNDLHSYRLQQQLYLQSRSLQLRQALIARGLTALSHGAADTSAAQAQPTDWDCALATRQHPKSCLYSFDAELGSKVVAPFGTTQYITLQALNRLRRTDPSKVEPLWHSQYQILSAWFSTSSKYSLYSHLSVTGTALSVLLDAPAALAVCMAVVGLVVVLATLPLWEGLVQTVLTHPALWSSWPNWGRFVHAALPLKLLLGQLAWKGMAGVFGKVYSKVRDGLIEWECQIWEDCIPLTVLEGRNGAPEEERLELLQEDAEEEDDDDDDDDNVFEDSESSSDSDW